MKPEHGDRKLKMASQRRSRKCQAETTKIKKKSTCVGRQVHKPSKPGSQAPSKVARISADELKEICNKEKYTHLKRNPVHKVSPTQNNISEQEFHSLNNTNLSPTVASSFLSKGHTVHTYFCTENSVENFWKKSCTVRNPQKTWFCFLVQLHGGTHPFTVVAIASFTKTAQMGVVKPPVTSHTAHLSGKRDNATLEYFTFKH